MQSHLSQWLNHRKVLSPTAGYSVFLFIFLNNGIMAEQPKRRIFTSGTRIPRFFTERHCLSSFGDRHLSVWILLQSSYQMPVLFFRLYHHHHHHHRHHHHHHHHHRRRRRRRRRHHHHHHHHHHLH